MCPIAIMPISCALITISLPCHSLRKEGKGRRGRKRKKTPYQEFVNIDVDKRGNGLQLAGQFLEAIGYCKVNG